ncbi:filamentous hemagglutinin N-terminal domain-containing protein [bacterium]|nr:filamentous hemagglutinin N-terminal domain-containing protein [bacterium]
MSKKSVAGSIGLVAYLLCRLWLFTPDYDEVPEGFKLSGKGRLLWNESTQKLTEVQKSKGVLTITAPVIPNIVRRSKVPGNSLILKITNGMPTSFAGKLTASGGVMIINPNGFLMGEGAIFDVSGAVTLSTLDVDHNDFLNGVDNRFRGSSGVTNFGTIHSIEGETILLGNFVESDRGVAMGAGGDIIVIDKPEKTTAFEFKGIEPVKK